MAQRRTKKHKQKQAEKQSAVSYSLSSVEMDSKAKQKTQLKKSAPSNQQNIFGYSLDFIKQDLIRTIVVTLIVVAVLAVIMYVDLRFT
jgi:hypothetical protein